MRFDSLVHENMEGHEQIRTKLETLPLAGNLDNRSLEIVISEPLHKRDNIHFSLVKEKDNKYVYIMTVAELLKLLTKKG